MSRPPMNHPRPATASMGPFRSAVTPTTPISSLPDVMDYGGPTAARLSVYARPPGANCKDL